MPHFAFASAFIHSDHIEAAGLILQFINVVISFGKAFKLFLLPPIDGIFGLAVRKIICPRFHFDKDKLIAIHGNNIDLADPSVREISFDNAVTQLGNKSAGFILAIMSGCFAAGLK